MGSGSRAVTSPALAVTDLSHSFGDRLALDKVGFTVSPGDFTVLLGLNGAGKSTLFALATHLYHNRSGSIEVFGFDIRRQPSQALCRMGVVFQQPTLDLDLSVEQNLSYHCALHGMARSLANKRIEAELDRLQLADRRRDKVRQLSGGLRRRVELARALLHEPSLLLLDEPTVGLDIASRGFLLEHVRSLCSERKLAVLWATHLIDEADAQSKVIVLHKGKVRAEGPAAEVIAGAQADSLSTAFRTLTGEAP
jgi:ABC-2 type transport system ATP-binding protein